MSKDIKAEVSLVLFEVQAEIDSLTLYLNRATFNQETREWIADTLDRLGILLPVMHHLEPGDIVSVWSNPGLGELGPIMVAWHGTYRGLWLGASDDNGHRRAFWGLWSDEDRQLVGYQTIGGQRELVGYSMSCDKVHTVP
jgi:hypothetical protein